MSLSVSYDGYMVYYWRCCVNSDSSQNCNKGYYEYDANGYANYTSTLMADNSYYITINSFYGSMVGSDHGYWSCDNRDGALLNNCKSPTTIYLATDLAGTLSSVGTYNIHQYGGISGGSWSRNVGQSFTLAPGESRTFTVGRGWASGCFTHTRTVTFRNTNTRPTPTPPSVSAYASCSNTSYTTGSFGASVSYGYCESQANSSSYVVTDDNGNTIRSGSGSSVSIGTLQANTKYNVTVTVSNGCYTRTSSASMITPIGNNITDVIAKTWDSGSVRIVPIMGGGVSSSPTHQIQITECNSNAWRTVATSTATAPTTVTFDGLVQETCYQIRCVTTSAGGSTCSYTSPVAQFTTPQKGICKAEFSSIDTSVDKRCSEAFADICYTYETLLTPADIIVYYRVKDGFDPTWLVADSRTINQDKGTVCFQLDRLFPNQVVYELYIHTHTAEVDWESDITTFTTELCPEASSDNCESLMYMTEILCASIKKLYHGNKKIYANPYSQELCDPYNEDPTHLTLWSRYLRLAHAYLCILCGFMNLSNSHKGQYLVGEIGWVQILEEIVDSQMEQDGWKLATSDAVYKYIHEKLKQVWHYQGTVDVMVNTIEELENYPSATSAIVKSEYAIYDKVNGEWVKNSKLAPEDFGVWHINMDSEYAKAESGWYFWSGTWNNLDADLESVEAALEYLQRIQGDFITDTQDTPRKIAVVDKSFDFANEGVPNTIYFVTESDTEPEYTYYTVTFVDDDGTVLREQQVLSGALAMNYVPVKEGNTFLGWTLDGNAWDSTLPITQDITVVANWQAEMVTVEFDIGDAEGTTPPPITVPYGSTISLPQYWDYDLEKEGATFWGWEWQGVKWTPFMSVYQDMTLTPIWEPIILTVAIRYWDGVPDGVRQVPYGSYLTPPTPVDYPGHVFVEWMNEDGTTFDFSKPITTNVVLVAKYVSASVTVSFNAQTLPDGADETVEDPEPQTISHGSTAAEPVIELENYIVSYWTLNGEVYNFDTPVTEDITLDAVWVEAFEVEFDANGGEPTPPTQKVGDGGYATKPEDPTKDGCEFEGWAEIPMHTVTVIPNNGNTPYKIRVEDGEIISEPAEPSIEGCTFDGWTDTYVAPPNDDVDFTIPPAPAGYHNVVFYKRNGQKPLVVQVKHGDRLPVIFDPTRQNCVFTGWTTDENIATVSFDPRNGNGEGKYSIEVNSGDTIKEPDGSYHSGCELEGWYINEEGDE